MRERKRNNPMETTKNHCQSYFLEKNVHMRASIAIQATDTKKKTMPFTLLVYLANKIIACFAFTSF